MINPNLTEAAARGLGRQIVKESKGVRVAFAQTNGSNVVHVIVPGSNSLSRTITSASEWDEHPRNERTKRNKGYAESQAMEALVEGNRAT